MRDPPSPWWAAYGATFIFLLLRSTVSAECVSDYYAEDISVERAADVSFYFTALEIRSPFDCAQFCANRKFCRTAVYNSFARSCAISYAQQVDCRVSTQRYLDDFKPQGHLVQMACFKDCHEYRYLARHPKLVTVGGTYDAPKMQIKIITGEPNDGKPVSQNPADPQTANLQNDAPPQHPAKGKVCFTTSPESYLLDADFQKISPASINECRCLCAATWKNDTALHRCLSLQYSASTKTCWLNKGTHFGKYDLIGDKKMTYQHITCDPKVLLSVASKTVTSPSTSPKPDGDKDLLEGLGHKTSTTPDCFEVIDGKLLSSSAGGLEQGISLEECQCLCANSKASGRFAFECLSATYYHNERDCVLNLENRETRPEAFRSDENVTYIGLTCSRGEALAQLVNPEKQYGCLAKVTTTTLATTTTKESYPSQSDDCFEELPSHVLEGISLAVEASVSPLQCKCFCANAEKRYGESCQSAQYYFESKTCLINKQNRFSNPENFNTISSGGQLQSYLEYKCAAKEKLKKKYLTDDCAEIFSNSELAAVLDSNSQAEVPVKKFRRKRINFNIPEAEGLDPKDFIDEVEEVKEDEALMKTLSRKARKQPKTAAKPTKSLENKDSGDSEDVELEGPESTTAAPTTKSKAPKQKKKHRKHKKHHRKNRMRDMIESEIEEEEAVVRRPNKNKRKHHKKAKVESEEDEKPRAKAHAAGKTLKIDADEAGKHKKNIEKFVDEPRKKEKDEDKASEELEDETEVERTVSVKESHAATQEATNGTTTTEAPKSRKFGQKKSSSTTLEATNTTTATTTTEEPTTTTTQFPGQCTYSAMYSTMFHGTKLIKEVTVQSPSECFAECHKAHCRSANLIITGDDQRSCELFRDSLIDYRRPDVLGHDTSAVYFDGIRCTLNSELNSN
ncbi:unnamed protein product, partial [Mesorhabditis spiculigera]